MNQTLSIPFQVKALEGRHFEGYASVFGNVDLGGDIVLRGAFKRSLAEHRKAGTLPPLLWMHQMDQVPGVWKEMKEDDNGLYVKGELVDTQLGNEVRTLLQKKAVRGLSIGYRTKDVDFDEDGNRLLKEIQLWETSIVTLAMNPLAQVSAAKARLSDGGEYVPTEREFEAFLRDAGYSRKVATRITAKVFDSEGVGGTLDTFDRRDADNVDDDDGVLASIHRLTDKIGSAALNR